MVARRPLGVAAAVRRVMAGRPALGNHAARRRVRAATQSPLEVPRMSRIGPLPVVLGALLLMGSMGGTTLAADPLIDPNPNASAATPALEGTEWLLVKA